MIFNIILIILFVLQTVLLLFVTIMRNRAIDKSIENLDDKSIENLDNSYEFYDFASPYPLIWSEWNAKQ